MGQNTLFSPWWHQHVNTFIDLGEMIGKIGNRASTDRLTNILYPITLDSQTKQLRAKATGHVYFAILLCWVLF